ncbi:hypothetical protein [Kitasatospora cineracea]|uniref:Uncharacterized protein n=1 Tax=Kitasatospora cineracea TaxID=88074 RepID=A0A8G1XEL8_9ACTN|nr:hypothetical protein [Kitasatospora cineracea]ROR42907.1 hypothetical protein EDD39_1041 [Kitasatospora cineracea]
MAKKRGVEPTPEENLAAAIVNGVLGTRTVAVDDQTEPGMIDAWLAGPDEPDDARTIGLEISSTTDGKNQAMWKSINKQYDETVIPGLRGAWTVRFRQGARIGGPPAAKLSEFLKDLERRRETGASLESYEDTTRWAHGWPVPKYATELDMMNSIGIISVAQISTDPALSGRVFASTLGHGVSSPTAEHMAPYVSDFLTTPEGQNKVKKLAKAPEAHLFIWSDSSHMSVGLALRHRFKPVGDPEVPDHIGDIWVASRFEPAAVYRWNRGSGWAVHEVSEELQQVPEPAAAE